MKERREGKEGKGRKGREEGRVGHSFIRTYHSQTSSNVYLV